jgi:hypothetical protein
MTLQVPFEQFAHTVKRVLSAREAYITHRGAGSLVTAAAHTGGTVVAAITPITPEAARAQLKVAGFETFEGAWSTEGALDLCGPDPSEAYVAAVAYESIDKRPGVWIDAYPDQPSQVQVLRSMYDEFRDTGELAEVSFEEFVRVASATVVIVSPAQIRGYLEAKESR